jgi:hypothetical protein
MPTAMEVILVVVMTFRSSIARLLYKYKKHVAHVSDGVANCKPSVVHANLSVFWTRIIGGSFSAPILSIGWYCEDSEGTR